MPTSCPFSLHSDFYGVHEENKQEESANRWVCRFCGKAFYEERFLDLHFVNRHSEYTRQGPSANCLADFCEIFRCDVMRKRHKPEYWDLALCKEASLQNQRQNCQNILKSCVPTLPNGSNSRLYEALQEKVCSYLTCERYWQLLEEEREPLAIAAYLMGSIVLAVCLFVYYYLAYTHFYTDDSIFDPAHSLNPALQNRPFFIRRGQSIRKRKERSS